MPECFQPKYLTGRGIPLSIRGRPFLPEIVYKCVVMPKSKKKKRFLADNYSDIRVKVIPKSSVNEVVGREGDTYKVKITSPPVHGHANKALVELLSKRLGISKGRIEITSGERSRSKSLRIQGCSEPEIMELLLKT